jgi:hypothetical protein
MGKKINRSGGWLAGGYQPLFTVDRQIIPAVRSIIATSSWRNCSVGCDLSLDHPLRDLGLQ